MQVTAFTKTERDEILRRYEETMATYDAAQEDEDDALAKRLLEEAGRYRADYFRRLPRVAMSCCPFDGKPLIRSFDPFGLDGLWWKSPTSAEELPRGPYLCVLRGAVNFMGKPPRAGRQEVEPGPEVPYVIPRLLEYPEMVMVIGQLEMSDGYIAYPLAYYAELRPPVEELTADWAGSEYTYTTQLGEAGWKTPNDPWDFDLLPWLEKGKVRWCEPGSDNQKLAAGPPDQCPYLNLPGTRAPMQVSEEGVFEGPLPDGEVDWPFEL